MNIVKNFFSSIVKYKHSRERQSMPTHFFRLEEAKSNWDGIPNDDLTWEEVKEACPVRRGIIEITPIVCPVCGSVFKEYKSDGWIDEDGTLQHMVMGKYCSKGHWTYLYWL